MISNAWRKLQHRLTVYLLADYRGSRFDGYCWALIGCLFFGMGSDLFMNIRFDAQLTDVTDADLNRLQESLAAIDEGCEAVKHQLTDELLIKAEQRRQYLDRLIRFCHTGK